MPSAKILKFPKRNPRVIEDEHEARKHALTAAAFRLMRTVLAAEDLTVEAAISFAPAVNPPRQTQAPGAGAGPLAKLTLKAIDKLVADGVIEHCVIDGKPSVRLR